MKKLTCIVLMLVMLLGLAACGKDEKAEEKTQTVSLSAETEEPEIAEEPAAPAEEEIEEEPAVEAEAEEAVTDEVEEEPTTEEIIAEQEEESVPEDAQTDTGTEEMVDGMRVSFKDAMDSYEAFYDEYVAFMQKYNDSDDTLAMLPDYLKLVAQAEEANKKIDEWDDGTLNDTELKYYIEVTSRISQKLVDIA